MMNLAQVEETLNQYYSEPLKEGERRKLIFWIDRNEEFKDEIGQLSLKEVKIHELTQRNAFQTKYLLEVEEPETSFLVYSTVELGIEDNWLADTMLYSTSFHADRISLILNDLGIDPSLRPIIKKNEKFFQSKERYRKFKEYRMESYTEENIEIGITSALCGLKVPDFESVLKTVLMESLDEAENKYLIAMEKFFSLDRFWHHVSVRYGYEEETQSLKKLFIHLTVTALSHSVSRAHLGRLASFIAPRNESNCLVFIDNWMHRQPDGEVYNAFAHEIEQELQLLAALQQIPLEEFKEADTFPAVDRAIILSISNSLLENLEDYDEYLKLIKMRRAKHFYKQYAAVYDALFYTVKMHAFRKQHERGIPQDRAAEMFKRYQDDYFNMDMYYRKFYVAFDQESDSELLKKLRVRVEDLYANWYMGELSAHWSQSVVSDLTEDWTLPGVQSQQQFYSSVVAPHIRKGERVFVIVSDAMRYEIGVELCERLNEETIGSCELEGMLGVVPSVTKLGMAALIPRREWAIDGNGQVLVNGIPASGIEKRKRIIESIVDDSVAIHYQDVLAMNKAGRREAFKGKKLVYLYHDKIDATGDKAATELYTFEAAEQALNELVQLVKIIRDDLSGTNIYLTSDHGFLYQRESLQESDKIEGAGIPTVEIKRRYMLSSEKAEIPGQIAVNLSNVVQNSNGLTAYLPHGTVRNKLRGPGVNFVHGGASLQEVVVPLLSFKNKRVGQKGVKVATKVDIKLTSTMRKITNSLFTLDFFQTEKVGEKTKSRTVVVYMADQAGQVLSNEETIIGDRPFNDPSERAFKLRFALKSIPYDRSETYFLIIKDTETGVVTDQISFTINLGIVSDFDF